jgi:hypothetical protein
MPFSRLAWLALLALAVTSTGCVCTELCMTNRTGTGIHVYSGHTKKVTTIGVGASRTVPHSSGRIIVITQRDEVWEYARVQSLVDEAVRSYKRVSLPVELGSDGGITLPSGSKLEPTHKYSFPQAFSPAADK